MAKILSKSGDFNLEYCCSIVRIGEIHPIEGKDKIGYTKVNGETIVVRKDQVKEGDILFYASNETQLHRDFLSANNLIEPSDYELNANAKDLEPLVSRNRELKSAIATIEKILRKLDVCSKFILSYDAEMLIAGDDADKKVELSTRLTNSKNTIRKYTIGITENSKNDDYIVAAKVKETILNDEIKPLKEEYDKNYEYVRSHVGFFNKNGRVRSIRLGRVESMGYLFTLSELAKWCPKVEGLCLNDLVGEDFDTVDGVQFIKAYVPYVPEPKEKSLKSKDEKLNKKIEKFDRMVKGEFAFHYSTGPLAKCIGVIKPTDVVTLTAKLHGTSCIVAKVKVKYPIKLPFMKKMWNKFVDTTGLFKSKRITDYYTDYGNVSASRKVIRNQYINENTDEGYYGVNMYLEYGDLLYPYLDEGMTVYGEIIGYVTGSKDKMCQPDYDYKCEPGTNKMMPYRITTTNEDGSKKEWNVTEVYEWTKKTMEEHPEIADRLYLIDILYHGTLHDLYPNVSLYEHWHENILEELRNDSERLGMEGDETRCNKKVAFEGIVLRVDDSPISEAWKLKSKRFMKKEKEDMDKGVVDMEMKEAYASK